MAVLSLAFLRSDLYVAISMVLIDSFAALRPYVYPLADDQSQLLLIRSNTCHLRILARRYYYYHESTTYHWVDTTEKAMVKLTSKT